MEEEPIGVGFVVDHVPDADQHRGEIALQGLQPTSREAEIRDLVRRCLVECEGPGARARRAGERDACGEPRFAREEIEAHAGIADVPAGEPVETREVRGEHAGAERHRAVGALACRTFAARRGREEFVAQPLVFGVFARECSESRERAPDGLPLRLDLRLRFLRFGP